MAEEAEDPRLERSEASHAARPPKTFAIAWKTEEHGPTLGFIVAERFAYFPATYPRGLHGGAPNAAVPAFEELFAPHAGRRVVLQAVGLPDGTVADATFRVEVNGMSGDNRNQD